MTDREEESCGFFQTIVESFVNSDAKIRSPQPMMGDRTFLAWLHEITNVTKQLYLMWRVDLP